MHQSETCRSRYKISTCYDTPRVYRRAMLRLVTNLDSGGWRPGPESEHRAEDPETESGDTEDSRTAGAGLHTDI